MQLQLGGQAQRVVSKVRGDKMMQVYANVNNNQQQKVQQLYGQGQPNSNKSPQLPGISVAVRRNKSNIKGTEAGMLQPLQGLNRNNSRPQLQLPELSMGQIQRPNASIDYNSQNYSVNKQDETRNQKLLSDNMGKGTNISPQNVAENRTP